MRSPNVSPKETTMSDEPLYGSGSLSARILDDDEVEELVAKKKRKRSDPEDEDEDEAPES